MADNERKIVTTFEANIDQFNAATQKLNQDIKGVNQTFQNSVASLDRWSDSQEGLKAKTKQLSDTLKIQQKALDDSKQKFAELSAAGKGSSKEAEQLASKILRQDTAVKKTQKDLDKYNDELKELKDKGVESKQALDKLNKELDESKQAAAEAGNAIKNGFLISVGGIAAACTGAISGLFRLVDSTAELRLEQGRVQTAFKQAGHSADTAKKVYSDFNAVLGDTAKTTEAMQHMAILADDQEELNKLVRAGTGVFATFGNSLPIESLMEAANETGRNGELTGALTDAIVWAGQSEEEFQKKLDKCNTEQERQSLIINTLNELYGEAGDAYNENNKKVIESTKAQNDYNEKLAELAEKVQPAITDFKTTMVEALTKIMDKFEEADIEKLVSDISTVLSELVTKVLPPLIEAMSWILDNMTWLGPTIMGVTTAILSATIAYKAITIAMNLAKIAQLGLNAAMLANPIGLVAAAIGVLVGAFVILWNKCEGFRNFWKKLWSDIKTGVSKAVEVIKTIITGLLGTIKSVVNGVISVINGAIRGINKISVQIPDWVPEFGGKTIGFNIPQIPLLAKGGVVDRPTLAMIGEAGKEAIMPLENNTAWIDKLADKLGSKMQGNTSYTITNNFEKMETSKLALHKANLEMKRIIGGR